MYRKLTTCHSDSRSQSPAYSCMVPFHEKKKNSHKVGNNGMPRYIKTPNFRKINQIYINGCSKRIKVSVYWINLIKFRCFFLYFKFLRTKTRLEKISYQLCQYCSWSDMRLCYSKFRGNRFLSKMRENVSQCKLLGKYWAEFQLIHTSFSNFMKQTCAN